jgi:hypothetical protein
MYKSHPKTEVDIALPPNEFDDHRQRKRDNGENLGSVGFFCLERDTRRRILVSAQPSMNGKFYRPSKGYQLKTASE